MFCYKCGEELVGVGLFCQICGAKQEEEQTEVVESQPAEIISPPGDQPVAVQELLRPDQKHIPPSAPSASQFAVLPRQQVFSPKSGKEEKPMQPIRTFCVQNQTLNIYPYFIEVKNPRYDVTVPVWSIQAVQCSPSLSTLTINSGGLTVDFRDANTDAYKTILKAMHEWQNG